MRLLLLGLSLLATPALAHDAPSGWAYAPECCNKQDCRQIEDDAVQIGSTGYRIKATGEVFKDNETRQSLDGHFHRCSRGYPATEIGHTDCLYVPPLGS